MKHKIVGAIRWVARKRKDDTMSEKLAKQTEALAILRKTAPSIGRVHRRQQMVCALMLKF